MPAKIWWKREVQIWGTETIKSMLRAGQSPDAIKKSTLVSRIIDIYALMLEADAWETDERDDPAERDVKEAARSRVRLGPALDGRRRRRLDGAELNDVNATST